MEGHWQEGGQETPGNVEEVMEDDQERDNRKRRNSGGSSSPQNTRRKRGRVVAGDFGGTVE